LGRGSKEKIYKAKSTDKNDKQMYAVKIVFMKDGKHTQNSLFDPKAKNTKSNVEREMRFLEKNFINCIKVYAPLTVG